ncbi:9398_t:CDS:2 [Dentiscutata erythropus]|uniref:9398_t:CDS:1 n=1 Tax=Dentiscutata erythropus TaxID=1348616 RepID=A0A9N8ZGK7_9GLOM|nr:9398_t:CDS:2 [Dentiscutata erythropus]
MPPSNIPLLPSNIIQVQFVGIFGSWIQCYSPCKRKYTCIFKGESADTTMAMILQDTEWSGQWYKFDQKVYVMLYFLSLSNFQRVPEIKIEWYTETLTDTHQNTISTGFITIKFQVDTISYQVQR